MLGIVTAATFAMASGGFQAAIGGPAPSSPVSGVGGTVARALDSGQPAAFATLPRRCNSATDDGEIVVCGTRSNEQYRLRPLANRYQRPNALGRTLHARLGPIEINGLAMGIRF